MLAIGIFWLGWSGNYESVAWWVPGIVSLGITFIIISFTMYVLLVSFEHMFFFCLRLKRLGTELSSGQLPDLLCVGDCGPNDHPLVDGRCLPTVHHTDVCRPGHQLGIHSPRVEAIAVLLAPMPCLFYK